MKVRNGFNTKNIIETLLGQFKVYADGDNSNADVNSQNPTPTQTNINFEDLIAKARKEEKEKLYPQINSLKEEVNKLTDKYNKSLLMIEELKEEKANLEKTIEELKNNSNKSDNEKIKALTMEIENLKKENEKLQNEMANNKINPQEIEEKVRQEYEVKLFREKLLREATEQGVGFIPELVIGTTVEELKASLEISKKRYEDILSKAGANNFNIPPVNTPTSKINLKNFTLEDLMKLDPRSQEYKELRAKLGLK